MALPPGELEALQAAVAALFDKTCTIQRPNKTMDGKGHQTLAIWTTLNGGAIACGFYKPRGQIAQPVGGELSSANQWVLQVPLAVERNGMLTPTDVKLGDRVLIGSNVYHVQNVNNDQSLPVCLEVAVLLIEGGKEDTP